MPQPREEPPSALGWTPSPAGRGSINILFACIATVALCSWCAVCLNVPAPNDSRRKKVFRKAWLAWVCFLGPEYLFLIALGQWNSARSSIKSFRMLGYKHWSIRHGFYTDMGGFALITSDGVRVPLCTKSLRWLLCQRMISDEQFRAEVLDRPEITEDRNQSYLLVRIIALFQSLWFCLNCIARVANDLPLTTLELTVLSFFIPTAGTYLVWRSKPCDVDLSHNIRISATLDEIRNRAGLLQHTWHNNPFDFVEGEKWHASLLYQYWLGVFRTVLNPRRWLSRSLSLPSIVRQRRSDSELMYMPIRVAVFEPVFGIPFLAANFAAWNWSFPTPRERFLWRLCSILLMAIYCLSPLLHTLFEYLWTPEQEKQRLQQYRKNLQLSRFDDIPLNETGTATAHPSGGMYSKYQVVAHSQRISPPLDDPSPDVPRRLLVVGSLLAAAYAICRGYILLEGLVAFRHMPPRVYQSVWWLQYFPHIG